MLETPFLLRLSATLLIATSASVWLPLNVLGFAVIALAVVVVIRRRSAIGGLLVIATAAVTWDAIFSSALYVFGIGGSSDAGMDGVATPTGEIAASTHLFKAPGGTEIATPVLGILAAVAVLEPTAEELANFETSEDGQFLIMHAIFKWAGFTWE